MFDLDLQLKNLYISIKPSHKETLKRLAQFDLLKSQIKEILPTAEIKLFGSFYTGLYLYTSDVDVSININTNSPNEVLDKVRKHLNLRLSSHIRHAKIPILKFKLKNINFDVSVNNFSGIEAAEYIKRTLNGAIYDNNCFEKSDICYNSEEEFTFEETVNRKNSLKESFTGNINNKRKYSFNEAVNTTDENIEIAKFKSSTGVSNLKHISKSMDAKGSKNSIKYSGFENAREVANTEGSIKAKKTKNTNKTLKKSSQNKKSHKTESFYNKDFKKIVVILKHYITKRKLGDAREGGLNSYSLYLLILNFYQMYPLNFSYIFLFDLIQYYGFVFNYKNVQVDCKNIKYKKNFHNRLSIIDPTNEDVDVGSTNKNFDCVIESFQNLYRSILYSYRNQKVDLFEIFRVKKKMRDKVLLLETSVNKLDIK